MMKLNDLKLETIILQENPGVFPNRICTRFTRSAFNKIQAVSTEFHFYDKNPREYVLSSENQNGWVKIGEFVKTFEKPNIKDINYPKISYSYSNSPFLKFIFSETGIGDDGDYGFIFNFENRNKPFLEIRTGYRSYKFGACDKKEFNELFKKVRNYVLKVVDEIDE